MQHPPTILYVVIAMIAGCTSPTHVPHTALYAKLKQIAKHTTITVAHRGDSGSFPENTLPAFESAVRKAADMVELDFHQTADNQLACIHDATLDRTTDSRRTLRRNKLAVAKFPMQELRKLDAGRWKHQKFQGTRIPSLQAALGAIQVGSVTMIEHKAGEPENLVALLRKLDLVDEVLVQSFHWSFLERLHALEPRLTLAVLGGSKKQPNPTGAVLRRIERTHSCMVHWNFRHLTRQHVVELHRHGYLVCVYTLNTVEDFQQAIAIGVDAITTDHPARLRSYLEQR